PTIAPHIRQRGFDHTRLIAKNLAKLRHLKLNAKLLLRKTDSVQHNLTAAERQKQAALAFEINPRCALAPEKILLLDDIYTTGATMRAAARILKKAGAREIIAAVVARQVRDGGAKINQNE
ncbi:MAG: hypothetical protein LBM73_02530, partial [Candidatus Nomurabacteria bacterium]|nr:hypothetical protein [Candidatus Nomurabacteria bacterium]